MSAAKIGTNTNNRKKTTYSPKVSKEPIYWPPSSSKQSSSKWQHLNPSDPQEIAVYHTLHTNQIRSPTARWWWIKRRGSLSPLPKSISTWLRALTFLCLIKAGERSQPFFSHQKWLQHARRLRLGFPQRQQKVVQLNWWSGLNPRCRYCIIAGKLLSIRIALDGHLEKQAHRQCHL